MNFREQPLNGVPRHWHLTRDIKPRGECKACDQYWAQYDAIEAAAGLKSVTDIGHCGTGDSDSK